MRLIIVSDSHGNSKILDEIASRYIDSVDAFVHCGDSELKSSASIWTIMDTVAGNCDFDRSIPDKIVNHSCKLPYLVVHGHLHRVKDTLELLKAEAEKEKTTVVFYGHSHIMKFNYEDGILFINPGSIQQPRGKLSEKTYCLLETEGDEVTIQVFNENHQEIPELNFSTNLNF